MDIRRIDVDHADDFAAWFAVQHAAVRHDLPEGPWWRERELRVVYTSSDYRDAALWLAEDAGTPVGAAAAELQLKDNPRLAIIDVFVRPDARRQGVGTAMLHELAEYAAAHSRPSVLGQVSGTPDADHAPGMAFAEAHGFTRRITDARRVQRAPFDLDRLAELERAARPHAEGYQVVCWRGQVPDEHVAEYAALVGRMSTDAPLEQLDYEPEAWDAQRVRVAEDRGARMGRDWWGAAAVAPDGSLAGMTEIGLAMDDDRGAYQGDTIVLPDHRGHRLGLLLKIANLRALLTDRPAVQAIWTWNAASNRFMISVNEQLGYVLAGWSAGYQRD